MIILGITGGIATGKSAVTAMLADLGAPTVSADVLARALLAPGTETTRAVLAAFPDCAEDSDLTVQTLDRSALARRIFADFEARARLEALTHPAIIAALNRQIALWRPLPTPRAAAAEIPLLFEAGLQACVDRVVVVTCGEATQNARLRARLGIDEAEAQRRIAAQWPLAEKRAQADVVITTDTSFEDTRRQVEDLWRSLPH